MHPYLVRCFWIVLVAGISLEVPTLGAGVALTVNTNTDNASSTGGSGSGTSGDLRYCLNYINQNSGNGPFNITFNSIPQTITLQNMLPILNLVGTDTININGTNGGSQVQLDGNSTYNGLFIRQGAVNISNFTIQHTKAQGGDGAGGGGGAMGAGGAIFIDNATVDLSNIVIQSSQAVGGNGGFWGGGGVFLSGGGGGMLRGGGAFTSNPDAACGGGGLGGVGGVAGLSGGVTTDQGGGGGGGSALEALEERVPRSELQPAL